MSIRLLPRIKIPAVWCLAPCNYLKQCFQLKDILNYIFSSLLVCSQFKKILGLPCLFLVSQYSVFSRCCNIGQEQFVIQKGRLFLWSQLKVGYRIPLVQLCGLVSPNQSVSWFILQKAREIGPYNKVLCPLRTVARALFDGTTQA